jgi:hypothetical protein
MRPRCVELARVLKKTGSFYYHRDWHGAHFEKVMLDEIFRESSLQNEIGPTQTSHEPKIQKTISLHSRTETALLGSLAERQTPRKAHWGVEGADVTRAGGIHGMGAWSFDGR